MLYIRGTPFYLLKLNPCISDVIYDAWKINKKLKINDKKTEFLIVNSFYNKTNCDNVTLEVGR